MTSKPKIKLPKKIKENPATIKAALATQPIEQGGSTGPEPTRYSKESFGEGDWEVKGRCTDF